MATRDRTRPAGRNSRDDGARPGVVGRMVVTSQATVDEEAPLVAPRDLIAGMRRYIDALAATDPDAVGIDDLRQSLTELQVEADRLAAWKLKGLASFDRRRPKTKAGPSPAQGLANGPLRQGRREGDRQVKTARRLAELPAVQASFDAGRISQRHADVLADTLCDARIRDRAAAQQKLLREAERLDPDQLRMKARALLIGADQDAAADQHRRNREERYLRTRTDEEDGSVAGSFRLDQLDGEVLLTAIAALMRPDPLDAPVRRTADQRRADALVTLAKLSLDHDRLPDLARQRPQLIGIRHHDDLDTTPEGRERAARRVAELSNTGPAPDVLIDRLSCDSDTTDVDVDRHGNPLHLGRTRREPTRALTLAVIARDRRCRMCGAPAWRCQAHHIAWWERDRGPTDIDDPNARLLSALGSHALVHDHRWTVELRPDNTVVFTDPAGRRHVRPPP